MKITLNENGIKTETIIEKGQVTIGRSQSCDVCLLSDGLSRQHCAIDYENGQFFITDLGSTNGVFIDGTRIKPNEKVSFGSFNIIFLGHLECQAEYYEPAPAPEIAAETKTKTKTKQKNSDFSTTTRILKSKEATKLLNQRKKKKDPSIFIFLLPLFVLGLAIYYQREKEVPPVKAMNAPAKTLLKTEIPSRPKIKAVDAFKIPSDYTNQYDLKSCQNYQNLCNSLKLSPKEGLFVDGSEFSLYLDGETLVSGNEYVFNKDITDPRDLRMMEKILPSQLITMLLSGSISQLHVVLINSSGVPYKVYRFHQDHFHPTKHDRIYALKLLLPVLRSGKDPQEFWAYIGKSTFILDLTI